MDPVLFSDDDGYTLNKFIRGVKGLHESVSFSYRPMGPEQVAGIRDLVRQKCVGKPNEEVLTVRLYAETLVKRIKSWDATNPQGQARTPEQGIKLAHPFLFQRLVSIVIFGADGGDDPDIKDDGQQSDEDLGADLDKALAGPGDHLKN